VITRLSFLFSQNCDRQLLLQNLALLRLAKNEDAQFSQISSELL
jgi:hypothetical protein